MTERAHVRGMIRALGTGGSPIVAELDSRPRAPVGMRARLRQVIERLAELGATPEDPPAERLRKGTLILVATVIVITSTAWVATYFALGLPISASIPLAYQLVTVAILAWFFRTKRFGPLRTSQLAMWLFLPVLLQASIGGFIPSSGVVLWSAMAPFLALVLFGSRGSVPWFVAYCALLVTLGITDPVLGSRATDVPTAVVTAFFVLNIGGVTATSFLMLRYFVRARDVAMADLERAHATLEMERGRSERLLLNVLPEQIAERLKGAEERIAERFDDVTVLFADLVGFTRFTEGMDPGELVALLDEIFSAFDDLADAAGLEKIKTIGDAYMVAGGLPERRPDHAIAVARMALGMRKELSAIEVRRGVLDAFSLRIGMDTGPVVAGVIGRRKFIYDLWGDTVNMASRMESQGVPGEIQVTSRARDRLVDAFELRLRGTVDVKGKGPMDTYLLVGPRSIGPGR
jgi:adenylate cyclase